MNVTEIKEIPIGRLSPHPRNKGIYGTESVEELASKIASLIEEEKINEWDKHFLKKGEKTDSQVYREAEIDGKTKEIKPSTGSFHISSKENDWYTPEEFIKTVRAVLGTITLDPASTNLANETVGAKTFFTQEDDGLDKDWFGNVFLNPPYSMREIADFTKKVVNEYNSGNINQAIVLTNNATDTAWCQLLFETSSVVFIPKRRVKFYNPSNEIMATRQGQIFFYIGPSPELFCKHFQQSHEGTLMVKYDS